MPDNLVEILHRHDVPLRFHGPLTAYAQTGKLVGAELTSRVRTLDNFGACVAELDGLYCLKSTIDGPRYTDAPHPHWTPQ